MEKERDAARAVLERFMPRAYRRPVDASEIDRKLALFDAVRAGRGGYVEAMKASLSGVLASPEFLYLSERAGEGDGSAVRRLSDHELAVRLSYFLWGSMPDAELRALADQGGLREAGALRKQVDRMLLDSRVGALGKSFAAQWLGLREVGANPPASDLYPQYDRHLQQSFVGESLAFFDEVLRGNRSVLSFLSSEFVTVNERLARFYGIDDVRGDAFRVVPAAAHRGGVMTQGAVLTITSNGTRTSPVKRGVWLLKNLLGIDPGLQLRMRARLHRRFLGWTRRRFGSGCRFIGSCRSARGVMIALIRWGLRWRTLMLRASGGSRRGLATRDGLTGTIRRLMHRRSCRMARWWRGRTGYVRR